MIERLPQMPAFPTASNAQPQVEPRCARCHFCVITGFSGRGDETHFQARCRRYAPNPEFPRTSLADWCGEFKATTLENVIENAWMTPFTDHMDVLKKQFNA